MRHSFVQGHRRKDSLLIAVLCAQRFLRRTLFAILILNLPLHAAGPWVSYDNRPLGSIERPLVLRSYLPEPGLDPAVFRQHDRAALDYVPRLVGNLFWKTSGNDPIELGGKSITELGPQRFTGYRLEKRVPVFEYSAGDARFTISVRSSTAPLSCEVSLTSSSDAPLGWRGIAATGKEKLSFTLTGTEIAKFQGYEPAKKITTASVNGGEMVFNQYGCAACHSIDGSKSHGPSVGKLAGTEVEIAIDWFSG